MPLTLQAEKAPIKLNDDGVALVGNTRVTLETVVAAYQRGATAEEIVVQYPVLALSDVYLVIGYYLHHRNEVDTYIRDQQAQSERVRQEIETRSSLVGIRERLLARRHDHQQE